MAHVHTYRAGLRWEGSTAGVRFGSHDANVGGALSSVPPRHARHRAR